MIFHEVYIGKNKDILAMERQLGKYRAKYMSGMKGDAYYDEDIRKFESMVEDYFGFDCFQLLVKDIKIGNAFTYPLGMRFDIKNPKKMIISNSKGFKFKKEAKYAGIVMVYSGLMFNREFTDEEIMAVILHEIGHNFQSALNEQVGILNGYHKALLIPVLFLQVLMDPLNGITDIVSTILGLTNTARKINIKLTRYLIDINPIFKFAATVCNQTSDIITNLLLEGNSLKDILTLGIFNVAYAVYGSMVTVLNFLVHPLIAALISLPIKTKNKMEEKIADNFATIYGYGPAQGRALAKLEDSEKSNLMVFDSIMRKIPVLGKLYQMNSDIAYIIIMQFDEHPHNVYRISSQIAMLENELKKSDLKPEMKKRIQNDLKQLKKDTNAYLQTSNGIRDNNFIAKAYAKFLAENSSGRLRDYLDGKAETPLSVANRGSEENMFNQYDDIFDRVYTK